MELTSLGKIRTIKISFNTCRLFTVINYELLFFNIFKVAYNRLEGALINLWTKSTTISSAI